MTTQLSLDALPSLLARYTKIALLVVALVAIASFAKQGIELFDFIQASKSISQDTAPQQQADSNESTYQVEHIISANLLGKKAAKKIEAEQPKDIPKTALNLTLRGTFANDVPAEGSALIEGSNKQAKHYKVGDSLEGNAVVDAVYSDRVILRRNGRQETLLFPEVTSAFASNNISRPSSSLRTNNSSRSSTTNSNRSTGRPDQKESIRQRLEQLRKKLRNKQEQN